MRRLLTIVGVFLLFVVTCLFLSPLSESPVTALRAQQMALAAGLALLATAPAGTLQVGRFLSRFRAFLAVGERSSQPPRPAVAMLC
jgi:hypothetical protein